MVKSPSLGWVGPACLPSHAPPACSMCQVRPRWLGGRAWRQQERWGRFPLEGALGHGSPQGRAGLTLTFWVLRGCRRSCRGQSRPGCPRRWRPLFWRPWSGQCPLPSERVRQGWRPGREWHCRLPMLLPVAIRVAPRPMPQPQLGSRAEPQPQAGGGEQSQVCSNHFSPLTPICVGGMTSMRAGGVGGGGSAAPGSPGTPSH